MSVLPERQIQAQISSSSTNAIKTMVKSDETIAIAQHCDDENKKGLSLLFAATLIQSSQAQLQSVPEHKPSVDSDHPQSHDVLCGRGGGINKHLGNRMYRRVVEYNKKIYRHVPKRHRILVSQSIVQTILNKGGRFLQHENGWKEISFRRAVQKTSQALRERSDSGVESRNYNVDEDGGLASQTDVSNHHHEEDENRSMSNDDSHSMKSSDEE